MQDIRAPIPIALANRSLTPSQVSKKPHIYQPQFLLTQTHQGQLPRKMAWHKTQKQKQNRTFFYQKSLDYKFQPKYFFYEIIL